MQGDRHPNFDGEFWIETRTPEDRGGNMFIWAPPPYEPEGPFTPRFACGEFVFVVLAILVLVGGLFALLETRWFVTWLFTLLEAL